MKQGPRTWLLGRLDAFLPEEGRALTSEDLSRARVLVGSTLLELVVCVLVVLAAPLYHHPKGRMVMGVLGGSLVVGLMLALGALRRGGSLRALSLGVCGLLVAAMVSVSMYLVGQFTTSHAAVMLLPLLAVYLLGIRTGFFITLVLCVHTALVLPLLVSRAAAQETAPVDTQVWAHGTMGALLLLFGWGLSALFSGAREEAASTARENERKLLSLLESTDDPVCALDPQSRLLTANTMARRLFREIYGQELRTGDALDALGRERQRHEWHARLGQVLKGQPVRFEWSVVIGGENHVFDLSVHPLLGEGDTPAGVTLFGRDITEHKAAEAKLAALNRNLLEVSRQAGMAEVATDVLHNVGNTLNSVNVSAGVVVESLRESRVPALARAVALLREHTEDPGRFLKEDARGRQLPDYLASATQHLMREHAVMLEEMQGLLRHVEHIRAVVSMQQSHARVGGWVEPVQVPELLDDALRLQAHAFERLGIQIHRDYAEATPVMLDRHRLLQIVVNLLNNARHAMVESGREDKRLSLRVWRESEAWLHIEVGDNGVGVDPEHLPRLFTHGFTTKKEGHGFGLHASALAAEAMNGHLRCDSGGRGQGARFRIELPFRGQEASA